MTRAPLAAVALAVVALTGCAPTPTAAAGGTVTVTAALRDGRADPPPRRVDVRAGDTVALTVDTDAPVEIHVHGFDVRGDAAPGRPARITFVADRPGLVDVEAHPDTLLLQLAVR